MTTATRSRGAAPELTVDECADIYPHQWVLMDVTERDERHHPHRGHVLAASARRSVIDRAWAKAVAAPAGRHFYIFAAEHYIRDGKVARELIRLASESDSYECQTLPRS